MPIEQVNGADAWVGTGRMYSLEMTNNSVCGVGTLVGGTATVNAPGVTSNSLVFFTPRNHLTPLNNINGAFLSEDASLRNPGTDFTVNSSNPSDDRDFGWVIVEPI